MKQNIYHLYRDECHYDEIMAFVIIAPHLGRAREMAQDDCRDEGPEPWRDCRAELLGPSFSDEPRVVCRDLKGG